MNNDKGEALQQAASKITYNVKDRMENFRALSLSDRSAVFNTLSPHVRQEILRYLSFDETVELLDHLDVRRAHQILDRMPRAGRRNRIIKKLKNDRHGKIEHFLQFHPRASIALLHLNYVLLADNTTVSDTAGIIEDHLHHTGKIPEVFVHTNGKVTGEIPLSALVRARNTSKLKEHVRPIQTILFNAARRKIIESLTAHPHEQFIVLDTDGSILGVVYSDDVIDLLGETPGTTLYSFAGVEESERPFDSVRSKVSHRYKWLILNLCTAFLAAGVVAMFEDTLTQIVLLAIYMPIIAGMGGNAATQTLAVMVRGIAVGAITLRNGRKAIIREMLAGLANGVITGTLVTIAAVLVGHDPMLGLVVGLSVILSLVVAGLFGTVIPLVLKYLGKDPATSATVFITTTTDVLGFIALLGLATLLLL